MTNTLACYGIDNFVEVKSIIVQEPALEEPLKSMANGKLSRQNAAIDQML
jgi:hypothetical protein